ncbi:MAG TPA: hypothetical protein VE860_11995 [Chthoniobacterales bacterium]|jgi:hypothetical protein|nr:hypothetical protein [Chthoniobacterales bacterium]
MSNNLSLLRQNYCRPATFTGNISYHLFPLEKECDEGKTVLRKRAAAPIFHLQEFDPSGLEQSYRDEATGAELPVFAVFNLDGKHRLTYEVTTEFFPIATDPTSLSARIPFQKSQAFVRKINEHRTRAERTVAIIAGVLGILPASVYLVSPVTNGTPAPFALWGLLASFAMLAYMLALYCVDRLYPRKKLVITAEFNGILPKDARERARAAREHFNNLYLIVDQKHRWKSELLPDPAPRSLDPLLVGELKQGGEHKFFVIHQFDLTEAEQYLADEFAATTPWPAHMH